MGKLTKVFLGKRGFLLGLVAVPPSLNTPLGGGGGHAELQITSSSYCSPQTTQKHGQVEMGLPLPTATSIHCIWSSFLPLQNCLPNEQRQHLC